MTEPAHTRLPPGQIQTRKWPVLHAGTIPALDPTRYRFKVSGLVERPLSLSWTELNALPHQETLCDIHCVTRWSRYDNRFSGIPVRQVLQLAAPKPAAKFVLVHAAPDYTTNLPLADLDRGDNLLATHHGGEPLTAEHGGPIRLVVPHLYFWKSAKWVTRFELLDEDWPGFWEDNGYHMRVTPGRKSASDGRTRPGCGAVPDVRPPISFEPIPHNVGNVVIIRDGGIDHCTPGP